MNEANEAINPGEGYRLLKDGEILQEGDEVFEQSRWKPTIFKGHTVGQGMPKGGIYRRKLEEPKAEKNEPAIDPGEGYRLLDIGEALQDGDEFLVGGDIWLLSNGHRRKQKVGDTGYSGPYRRKIETTFSVDTGDGYEPLGVGQVTEVKEPNGPRRKIYIAGPMRGYEGYNFPAFDSAAEKLYNEGWEPINPADIDRDKGFDPEDLPADWDWNQLPETLDLREIAVRDIEALSECEAIYLLPGWEFSKGSLAEVHFAKWLDLEIIFPTVPSPIENAGDVIEEKVYFDAVKSVVNSFAQNLLNGHEKEDILEEALRITRGDRQAQYGPPDQDFRRTAGIWTSLFGHLLKDGAAFEPMHVALAMIGLKLSRQMHQRKRDNWTDIAGYARCGSICDEVA